MAAAASGTATFLFTDVEGKGDAALPGSPGTCAVRGGTAWTIDNQGHALYSVDVRHSRYGGTVGLPFAPTGVAAGPEGVWVRGIDGLSLVDPYASRVIRTTVLPAHVTGLGGYLPPIVETGGSLWLGNPLQVLRIDRGTSRVAAENRTITSNPTAFAGGLGAVWVVDSSGLLWRLDPRSATVLKQTSVGSVGEGIESGVPTDVVIAAGALWMTDPGGNKVWELDATGTPSGSVSVGHVPVSIASVGGSVWVADQNDNTLAQIEPGSGKLARMVQVGRPPVALCAAGDKLVVAVQ